MKRAPWGQARRFQVEARALRIQAQVARGQVPAGLARQRERRHTARHFEWRDWVLRLRQRGGRRFHRAG